MGQVTVAMLEAAFLNAWCRETSADPDGWSEENPAWGQCAVTSLVAQDYLGGEVLLRASLEDVPGFEFMRSHYWNLMPNPDINGHAEVVMQIDFTKSQFPEDIYALIPNGEFRSRESLLSTDPKNEGTIKRYTILKDRVARALTGENLK